ncbi:MAG: hypothetical protein LLG93_10590 [Deltaproteobacteria bacterium]|nr:hypothetical protein [Deltaproteobacteria bacterium]
MPPALEHHHEAAASQGPPEGPIHLQPYPEPHGRHQAQLVEGVECQHDSRAPARVREISNAGEACPPPRRLFYPI